MKAVILSFLLLLTCQGYGQQKLHYVSLGTGLTYRDFFDEAISLLPYAGTGVSGHLGFRRESPKTINAFSLEGSSFKLKGPHSSDLIPMKIGTTNLRLEYSHLRKWKNWKAWQLAVGGYTGLLTNVKLAYQLDNSAIVYDNLIQLGMGASATREMKMLKRQVQIQWQANLPLLFHTMRPPYLNRIEFIDPESNILADAWQAGKITTWGKSFRLQSILSLSYPLKNGNQFRLQYNWEMYTIHLGKRVAAGEHGLQFHLLFKL